nr:SagB/ThcOx family dehydrogenase [Kineosporia mesophila]
MPAHVLALVDRRLAGEGNALRAGPVPLRDLVVAPDQAEAELLSLEAGFAVRLSTPQETAFTGAAADEDEAVLRSLLRALEVFAVPRHPWEPDGLRSVVVRVLKHLGAVTFSAGRAGADLFQVVAARADGTAGSGWGRSLEEAAERSVRHLVGVLAGRWQVRPIEVAGGRLPIRDFLRENGRGVSWRVVHQGDGLVVVQTRLRRPVPRKPWSAPAPNQLNLAVPDERVRLSRLYHENSKLQRNFRDLPPVDLATVTPALQTVVAQAARVVAPGTPEVRLPRRDRQRPQKSLDLALRSRRSWAGMDEASMTLDDLGHLLDSAIGVTGSSGLPDSTVRMPMRAFPASGGLFSTDVYVYARRIEGLAPGVHYYEPIRHSLHHVRADCDDQEVLENIGYPARARQAAAVLVFAASFRRLQWKYWERAYRMVHLDCGHLAQNVILVAGAMDLVAHPMIAFTDDYFDRLTGVNGQDEAVIHLTLLGPARAGNPRPKE